MEECAELIAAISRSFNRTTVECKYAITLVQYQAGATFNRTTVECKYI